MYQEIIKQHNPKPAFNLTWYKEQDLYSDGDVEDTIIRLIAENPLEQYGEAVQKNFNWPVYYHLTHVRKNILNWYPFSPDGSVLEIGCGMGAVTRILCEKCKDVTAVELSKRRATATLLRCRDKENLEIIVGNLNDIKFNKKFDYITLIGVLEYQGEYTDTDNPYLDFLTEIKKLLKPGGKLLIAIENQYGLKYWCGAREDHTGIPFEGMNQYTLTNKKIRTFSKEELNRLVHDSGFNHTFFYYPLPDYKLPSVLYSEKYLPENENLQNARPYYIPDKATLLSDEMGMYKDIIENGVFEFFANSFLVECSDNSQVGEVIFGKFSLDRQDKYQIATIITDNGQVQKIPLNGEMGIAHLKQIAANQANMGKMGLSVLDSKIVQGKLVSKFVNGEILENRVLDAFRRKNEFEVYRIFDEVKREILRSSDYAQENENVICTIGIQKDRDGKDYGPIMKIGYLDMILRNAFYKEGGIEWFDQEWILENVPANFILFRAVAALYQTFPWVDSVIPLEAIAVKYGIASAWEEYLKLDKLFSDAVLHYPYTYANQVYRGGDRGICIGNINKIIS